jgi:hypothetical protein
VTPEGITVRSGRAVRVFGNIPAATMVHMGCQVTSSSACDKFTQTDWAGKCT